MGDHIKPREYTLIARAVEKGVRHGWHRAHKHVAAPEIEAAVEEITHNVMLALTESFIFEGELE